IYQTVTKVVNERALYSHLPFPLTITSVYSEIKRSNSSLSRKNKRLLEDSIARVIAVIKEDGQESDSVQEDLGSGQDEIVNEISNSMNRKLVNGWAKSPLSPPAVQATGLPGESAPLEPVAKTSPSKRDRDIPAEPIAKRRKAERLRKDIDHPATADNNRLPPSNASLSDLGGVDSVIRDLTELIALPMLYPEVYIFSGIQPPRGVLLYGPSGCGKTMIATAFAAELGVSFIPISAPSIVSGMSGESEKKLREYFEEAKKIAPCLMFIDEIDAITPKRESAQREMEKRIVAQMLTCMDDLALEKTDGKPVIIIAATNRPDSLDPALRRAGRFNKEINLSVPDQSARELILRALTSKLQLSGDFDFRELAKMTPGFVGADLNDLVSTAGVAATKRVFEAIKMQALEEKTRRTVLNGNEMDIDIENGHSVKAAQKISPDIEILRDLIERSSNPLSSEQLSSLAIINEDFLNAIPKIQPSSQREGFATIPNTTWADIGALHSVRDELQMAIVEPIKRPERYERVGITAPTGVLLWGPPGCGKTLLAKAVANESRANFISVKGPELLNKYVGESERAVRQVFARARSSVPCVIFFDELDALVPSRTDSLSEASSRVVNTLLTELDGLNSRTGIYVIAATNRPDIIDPAMLRPGRLGTLLFVDLPSAEERVEILRTLARRIPVLVDIEGVAGRCDGFSGADLESLLRAAGIAALKRNADSIEPADFDTALTKVHPSVGNIARYRKLRARSDWGR
ncbi:MAG: hypothetical protein M1829_006163, partial [Trizodia sp. TS-e1964]